MAAAGNDVGFKSAVGGALDALGTGVLGRPREFAGVMADLYDPAPPEVMVISAHCDDDLLRPFAKAAAAGTAAALERAAWRAEMWLRYARVVDERVARNVAWGIARGVAAHLGIEAPRDPRDAGRPEDTEREEAERLIREREERRKVVEEMACGAAKPKRRSQDVVAVIAVIAVIASLVVAVALNLNWHRIKVIAVAITTPAVSVPDTSEFEVGSGIDDYSWPELKAISNDIAAAESDEEGLRIAKEYHLVDSDGRLGGDTKAVTLTDGRETSVRILGFRHDELAGGGKAGITFEFADSPATHRNKSETNEGGWDASGTRFWLNSDFLKTLPDELRGCVEPVSKRTNNKGEVDKDETSAVTSTADRLWLLSSAEVYGSMVSDKWRGDWSEVYAAEGTQYQLYADQYVTIDNEDFCRKGKGNVTCWTWMLRSPHPCNSSGFEFVYVEDDWITNFFSGQWITDLLAARSPGMSPGFCF